MSSVNTYCSSSASYSIHTDPVFKKITATTTPVEFEDLRKKYPQFQLEYPDALGSTVMHKAAKVGNVPLIEYIVKQAPQLLERGNHSGETPLSLAATLEKVEATESLLSLGANVNVTHPRTNDSLLGYILETTPDYKKIDSPCRKIVKLLIKHGAQLPPTNCKVAYCNVPRPQAARDRLESAKEGFAAELAKERRKISDELCENVSYPKVLSEIIAEYV